MDNERPDTTARAEQAVPAPRSGTDPTSARPPEGDRAEPAPAAETAEDVRNTTVTATFDGEEVPDPEYAVDESALRHDCDLWFALPPGFVEVPVDALAGAPTQEQTEALLEAVTSLLDLLPPERQEEFLTHLKEATALPGVLRQAGMSHCCLGLHLGDDGRLLQSVLTVVWREHPWTPPKLTAARAALAVSEDTLSADYVNLPCGPGALTETIAERADQKVYQATGYLPHPDGRQLVIVTLSSPAVEARGYFRDMLDGIVRMVSFENPLPEHIRARVPESETVASMRAAFG